MDKNLKAIYQNILNNKLPEENIPQFFNQLVNEYYTFASVRLAMHYYTLYESYSDEGERWSDASIEVLKLLNQIIARSLLKNQGGTVLEEEVRLIDRLRNEVMNRMNYLTSLTDMFQIHEYILNRVEFRFVEELTPANNEDFAREVLSFIFDTKDNVIINDRIREVLGQLPIRMTKQKYFDLLRGSLREYIGANQDSLDTYLYMLRTSAMLNTKEDMKTIYPKLWEQKLVLDHLDYKNITKAGFEEAQRNLKLAALTLEEETSVYYGLQEIINEVYAMLLCAPYTGVGVVRAKTQEQAAVAIIGGINEEFRKASGQEPPVELLEHFALIEGVQEELSFDLTALEEALYQIDQNHRKLTESIMADKLLNVLLLSRDLLSNSLFIDFYEIKSTNVVSEEKIEIETKKLIEELTVLFENHDKMVSRAIMASTINKMPVFFQDHKSVMDYVLYSLEKCSDAAEKSACIDIIRSIMSA